MEQLKEALVAITAKALGELDQDNPGMVEVAMRGTGASKPALLRWDVERAKNWTIGYVSSHLRMITGKAPGPNTVLELIALARPEKGA